MKMNKIYTTSFLLFFSINLIAQIPTGYYNSASGTGYTLKTQLHNIIDGHTVSSYTPGVWDAFETTDKRADGKVWDMYSSCDFTFVTDQDRGTGGTSECEYYNREHSFPKSWFDDASPMTTDLFHIYATDKYVNGLRSNYPFGETNSPTETTINGSKLGPSAYAGYTGTVFEPIDEYKGDFARTYFYMATRYENIISNWTGSDMLDGSSDQCFTDWAINLLISWNISDPVSQKEIDRNNAVHDIQDNRNPFIDHPEWVECIWGSNCTADVNHISKNTINIFPNPAKHRISIISNNIINKVNIYNILGKLVSNTEVINSKKITTDVSYLTNGIYFIEITDTDNNKILKKLIKE